MKGHVGGSRPAGGALKVHATTAAAALAATVVVCWVLACLPPPVGTWPVEPIEWPGPVPAAWRDLREGSDPFDYAGQQSGFGRVDIQVRASITRAADPAAQRPASVFELYSFDRRAFGWPFPALACDRLQESSFTSRNAASEPVTGDSREIDDMLLVRGLRFSVADRLAGTAVRLPLRILYGGFLANAGLLFLGVAAPFWVHGGWVRARRRGRRQAGRCGECGYDLAGAARCPECGVVIADEVERTRNHSGAGPSFL
ncbi:MAG: hypothetical protein ACT4PL_00600 [Phycisphaerales bacterium]